MYVALKNFAYHGKTYFVGDETPFVADLIDAGLIGYDEELEDEADGPVQSDN
jgi:hypothetical protein